MKNFTTIILFLVFFVTNSAEAQFCCCPFCPTTCVVNTFFPAPCTTQCTVTCGNAGGFQSSANATCLGTACNMLPVELAAFETKVVPTGVELYWETESERNNEGFEIQRMSGINMAWEIIGFEKGAGNSDHREYYYYEDRTAPPGINYYRLQQIDYDGSSSFTPIETARVKSESKFTLWPTVAKDHVIIRQNQAHNHNTEYELLVYDMMGRMVEKNAFIESTALDISRLQNGNYIVNIKADGVAHTFRFIKAE